jgi:hypothetical protein
LSFSLVEFETSSEDELKEILELLGYSLEAITFKPALTLYIVI